MKYKDLLFDLDGTLLDFSATEALSLPILFTSYGYKLTKEWLAVYNTTNKQLWADYEAGHLCLQDVLNSRFSQTMAKLGYQVDGVLWEDKYRELLSKGRVLINDALEVCKRLAQKYQLYIVTNGLTEMQNQRTRDAGLADYFSGVFTSEQAGEPKPSPKFFNYIAKHILDFDSAKALIIGDSLGTDIKGGILASIDTCWYNPNALESGDISPTYTIASLTDLYSIL